MIDSIDLVHLGFSAHVAELLSHDGGWVSISETDRITYNAANRINWDVPYDLSRRFSRGMWLRLTQGGVSKIFCILSVFTDHMFLVPFSGVAVTNEAVTAAEYSTAGYPLGYKYNGSLCFRTSINPTGAAANLLMATITSPTPAADVSIIITGEMLSARRANCKKQRFSIILTYDNAGFVHRLWNRENLMSAFAFGGGVAVYQNTATPQTYAIINLGGGGDDIITWSMDVTFSEFESSGPSISFVNEVSETAFSTTGWSSHSPDWDWPAYP